MTPPPFTPAQREPRLFLANRQRAVPLSFLPALRRFSRAVLPGCLARPGAGEAVLPALETVHIVLVSDRRSGQLHERFLSVPGPTDVITFMHGEIVIGVSVAQRQAREHRQTLERELRRYVVHGLLHLNGHEDDQPESAKIMWRAQEQLLRGGGRTLKGMTPRDNVHASPCLLDPRLPLTLPG